MIDLLYPIKWLLRGRVKRYEYELEQITYRDINRGVNARRSGFTYTNNAITIRDFWLRIKYERFIKRWKI